jgi:hypothetical protein
MRTIDERALEDIAAGAVIMGSGGGGDPYIGMLMARQAIREHGPVDLVTLDELEDEDLVVPCAMMGAPTVMVEKVPGGDEVVRALQAVARYLGKPARATMSAEVGGLNSMVPFYAAARLRLAIVDCDGTGRAFPEVHMSTYTLHGISATPFAMADERGNTVLLETVDNRSTETFARVLTVQMGAVAMVAAYPSTVAQLKEAAVPGTITQAQRIGAAIRTARLKETDPAETVREAADGFLVFEGKVGDVERRTEGGFHAGHASVSGISGYDGQQLWLGFRNEFLAARIDGAFAVTVPDIITVLDLDTGEPITAEGLRYGYRVAVIGIPCTPKWRTPAGLGLAGPRSFGYETDYVPVEQRHAG